MPVGSCVDASGQRMASLVCPSVMTTCHSSEDSWYREDSIDQGMIQFFHELEKVTVTSRVSPLAIVLSPPVKLAELYKMPLVPVATVQTPAPATVAAPLNVYVTAVAASERAEAVPKVSAGRLPE